MWKKIWSDEWMVNLPVKTCPDKEKTNLTVSHLNSLTIPY